MSGAKVTATNTSTNFTQSVMSDGSGEYHLLALTPGHIATAVFSPEVTRLIA